MRLERKDYTIVSFNIDTNIGLLNDTPLKKAFPRWTVEERIDAILHYILSVDADIICLQELRDFIDYEGRRVDSITRIRDAIGSRGYTVLVKNYIEGSEKAFKYLTAYKKSLSLVRDQMVYFTKTGSYLKNRDEMSYEAIKDHNFGVIFERGIYVTVFENGYQELAVVNNHFDVPWVVRKKSAEILHGLLRKHKAVGLPTVCVGDFNTFPDWYGEEQCDIIKRGLHTETFGLCENALEEYTSSFIAPPYDFCKMIATLKKEGVKDYLDNIKDPEEQFAEYIKVYEDRCEALGSRLDNVFHFGFKNVDAEIILTPTKIGDIVEFKEDVIKKYVLERAKDKEPAFASDHQLIKVNIVLE